MGHPGHHRRHRCRAGLSDPPAFVAGRATRRQADQGHVGRHHLRRQSPAAAVPHRHPDPGGGDAAHRLSRSKRPRRPDHAAGTDSDRHRRPALRQFPTGSHISTDGPPGGVERQAAEGPDADRTGHRLPGRRHPRLLDSSRPLSGDVSHRSGRFGRDLHAGLPRQHPGFRIGHPTVGQQHAQSRRLDQHAQVRRRRHGGGGHAQHGQSPQLGQHDRHPPALPAGERLVPKLGRNAFLGRAPR